MWEMKDECELSETVSEHVPNGKKCRQTTVTQPPSECPNTVDSIQRSGDG